jgi:hypothetical protein
VIFGPLLVYGWSTDIGGGQGHLLTAVLETTEAHGTLFDLPRVIDGIKATPERATLRPGDLFIDPLPIAQAYRLMDVPARLADERAAAILTAIRRAAPRGATLLIIEAILPEGNTATRAATLDVILLNLNGGRDRPRNSSQHSSPPPGSSSRTSSPQPARSRSAKRLPSNSRPAAST